MGRPFEVGRSELLYPDDGNGILNLVVAVILICKLISGHQTAFYSGVMAVNWTTCHTVSTIFQSVDQTTTTTGQYLNAMILQNEELGWARKRNIQG